MMQSLALSGDIESLAAGILRPVPVRRRLMVRFRLIACTATGIVLAAAGAVYVGVPTQPAFEFAAASRGDVSLAVVTTGTIDARRKVEVGAEVSGLIRQVDVDFNASVKRGQLLAVFDSTQYDNEVVQSRAQLQVAQAGELQARTTLVETARQLKRQRTLSFLGAGSSQQADQAEAAFGRAIDEMHASQARVTAARAALDLSLGRLAKTRVLSPADGIVLDRAVQPGQVVIAALQTPHLFTIMENGQDLTLMASVSEADIATVSVGQNATFSVDGVPQTTYAATVTQIRAMPYKIDGVVSYQVELSLPNPDRRLMPGMTAAVSIQTAQRHAVLRVPNTALRFLPPGHHLAAASPRPSGQGVVWIGDASGQPRAVDVSLGLNDGRSTEITGGNLREGQAVLVGVAEAPAS